MKYIKLYENFDIEHYFAWLIDEMSVQLLKIDKDTIDIYIQSYDLKQFILDDFKAYLYDSINHLNEYYINNIEFQVEYRRINVFHSDENNKSLESILKSINWTELKPSDNISLFKRPMEEIVIRIKKKN